TQAHRPAQCQPWREADRADRGELRPGHGIRHHGLSIPAAGKRDGNAQADHVYRQANGEPDRQVVGHRVLNPEADRVNSMTMPPPAVGSQPPDEAPTRRRSTELWMMLFACGIVL